MCRFIEKSKYISPLSTKYLKTVCDLLGEVQVVVQQLSTKVKKTPNPGNICKCDKSMQLEFSELSREKQLFEINFPSVDNLDQKDVSVQVNIPKIHQCNLHTCIDTSATFIEVTDNKIEVSIRHKCLS